MASQENGTQFTLFVTHVDSEGPFLKISGQCDKDSTIYVESLIKQCKDQLDSHIGAMPSNALLEGIICLAKYKDGAYYRAKIVSRAQIEQGFVSLHFIDYGNRDLVQISHIKSIHVCHDHLATIPAQATDYLLARVMEPTQHWNETLISKLRNLLCYSEYPCVIEGKTFTTMFIGLQYKTVDMSTHLVNNHYAIKVSVVQQQMIFEKYMAENLAQQPDMQMGYQMDSGTYVEHIPFNSPHNFPSNPAASMRVHNVPGVQHPRGYVPPIRVPFSTPPPAAKPSNLSQRLVVAKTPKQTVPLRQQKAASPAKEDSPTSPVQKIVLQPIMRSSTYKIRHLEIGSTHEVQLAFVEDGPSKFFVHLAASIPRFQALMDEINKQPMSSLRAPPISGSVCLGMKSTNRVICRTSVAEVSETHCLLYFVDFGVFEQVAYHDIFDIPEEFLEPEVFAHCISLSKIKLLPSGSETNEVFRNLVSGKRLLMKVVAPEGPPLVQYGELHLNGESIWDILSQQVKPAEFPEPAQLPLGGSVSVMVSYVDSCLKFFVQLSENIDELDTVMENVQAHCAKSPLAKPRENAACCALFPDDERWYRARVLKVNPDSVLVFYVDYGNEQEVPFDHIKPITSAIASFPAQAIKCTLKGFEEKPVDQLNSNQLEMLALEKTMLARVVGNLAEQLLVTLLDESVAPVLDVAKRMLQLTQPRGSKSEEPASTTSAEKQDDYSQRGSSFRNKGDRNGGRDEAANNQGGPREKREDGRGERGGWGKDKRSTEQHFNDKSSIHSSGSEGRQKREYATNRQQRVSVQQRLQRDNQEQSNDWEQNDRRGGRRDNWGEKGDSRAERKPWNNEDRRGGPRGDRGGERKDWADKKDDWADKKSSYGEKKDDWGSKKDSYGEMKDDWGAKKDSYGEKKDDWGAKKDYGERKDNWGAKKDSYGDKKDDWGSKKDSYGEKKDDWGSKKDSYGEKKDDWGAKKDYGERKDNWGAKKDGYGDKKDGWGSKKDSYGDKKDDWGSKKDSYGEKKDDWGAKKDSWGDSGRGERKRYERNDNWGGRDEKSYNRSFGSNSEKTEPKLLPNPIALDTQYESPTIEIGSQVEVSVAWLISPDSFYAQIVSLQSDFIAMMNKIPDLYKGVKNYSGSIEVGSSVLARFPEDKVLYRASVLGVQPFGKYIVQYIDFGNKYVVDSKDIWQLDSDLMVLPKMAVHCSLMGVQPLEGEWKTSSDMDLCFNTPRYQCIFQELLDDRYKVSLWNNGVSVAQILTDKGLCKQSEETSNVALKDEPIDLNMVVGQQMMCKVTYVESFEKIYIQLDLNKVKLVEEALSTYDKTLLVPLTEENLVVGTHCLTRQDDQLFRAIITKADDKEFEAALPDYGKTIKVKTEEFMFLPTELSLYYYQSLECVLNNLTTDSKKLVTEEELKQKLEGNKFIVYINDVDGTRLLVTFYDRDTGKKVAIFEPDEGAYDTVSRLCMRSVYTANFGMALLSHVETLNEVYLQHAGDIDVITELLDRLYKFYEEGSPEALESFEVDSTCAAKSEDGNWYRAIITSEEEGGVRIQYIDYGNCEVVPMESVKKLDDQFYEPCALAVIAELGLNPLTDDAVDKLLAETGDSELLVTLAASDAGWRCALHRDGVDLAMSLVSQGVAVLSDNAIPASAAPENDGRDEAFVSHADSPGQFWIQFDKESERIDKIQAELQADAENYPELNEKEVGTRCVAKYSVDEQWYRAIILDAGSEIVTVRFTDYGNTDVLTDSPDVLKAVPSSLESESPVALKCSVDAVPTGTGEWSESSAEIFQELLGDLEVPVRVKIILPGDTNYVEIFAQGKDVTEELVKAGHATRPQRADGLPATCYASHVNSPSEFWIQLESSTGDLEAIEAAMSDVESFPTVSKVEEGALVVALYPEDGAWYRAQVLTSTEDGAEVIFIDYGNASLSSQLKELPAELGALPALARKCALQRPRALPAWPAKAAQEFEKMAAEGATVFQVEFIAAGDISIVELTLDGKSVTDSLLAFCPNEDNVQKEKSPTKTTSENMDSVVSESVDTKTVSEKDDTKVSQSVEINEDNIQDEKSPTKNTSEEADSKVSESIDVTENDVKDDFAVSESVDSHEDDVTEDKSSTKTISEEDERKLSESVDIHKDDVTKEKSPTKTAREIENSKVSESLDINDDVQKTDSPTKEANDKIYFEESESVNILTSNCQEIIISEELNNPKTSTPAEDNEESELNKSYETKELNKSDESVNPELNKSSQSFEDSLDNEEILNKSSDSSKDKETDNTEKFEIGDGDKVENTNEEIKSDTKSETGILGGSDPQSVVDNSKQETNIKQSEKVSQPFADNEIDDSDIFDDANDTDNSKDEINESMESNKTVIEMNTAEESQIGLDEETKRSEHSSEDSFEDSKESVIETNTSSIESKDPIAEKDLSVKESEKNYLSVKEIEKKDLSVKESEKKDLSDKENEIEDLSVKESEKKDLCVKEIQNKDLSDKENEKKVSNVEFVDKK